MPIRSSVGKGVMGKKKQQVSSLDKTKSDKISITPVGQIEQSIMLIRGEKVIIDADLAGLYGVETKRLNERVRRNKERFPEDFLFQLTHNEAKVLRSQSATSKGRGGRRYAPYAFTEHGAIMAATVLNSPKAVQVSVYIVRAFVRLRRILSEHKTLAVKLDKVEGQVRKHDRQIVALVTAIQRLMEPPSTPPRKRIGFQAETDE